MSAYFETLPYRLDESTGRIDYEALEKNAMLYRPKIIVAGASAYARNIDYARMRDVGRKKKFFLAHDLVNIECLDCR